MSDGKIEIVWVEGEESLSEFDITQCKELNEQFRNSEDPTIAGIKRCIQEQGIEPSTVVFADVFPDGPYLDHGLLIANNGIAYEFDYLYQESDPHEGRFTSWKVLPDEKKWNVQLQAAKVYLKQKNT
jgi:hypothetical protein